MKRGVEEVSSSDECVWGEVGGHGEEAGNRREQPKKAARLGDEARPMGVSNGWSACERSCVRPKGTEDEESCEQGEEKLVIPWLSREVGSKGQGAKSKG